jgi:excisionase family DNA binding protein
MKPADKLLKVEEVASKMRVNRRTVQTWIDSGNLAATDVRPDGAQRAMWRIESSDLVQFAKRRKKERQS